ncbi:MAG: colicin import membrane protein [Candidatus Azotimanducaceae bacterium]|jgi:colicin import membrane protein
MAWTLAILLHGAVVGAFMFDWQPNEQLVVSEIQPYYIEASLAQENPHTAKQKRQDAATAEKNRRLRIKRNVDKKAALNKSQQLEADQLKALADAKLEAGRLQAQEVDLAIAERVVPNEEILAESRNELDRAIEDERNRRKAVTDDEKAMAYVAQIQADIVQNWSRPPSARNGMQALLKVFLVPTGEVVDVTLIESSGNEAFDRSVLLAVRKTERFLVPDDARQFERTFREFEVLFRPDDLRL